MNVDNPTDMSIFSERFKGGYVICTSVIPCFSSGLARNYKIMPMFVLLGQWSGLTGTGVVGTFLILLYFVASPGQSRPYSVAETKPKIKGFLVCCDMEVIRKWTVSLTFIRCKFDSLMASYFCTSLQGRKCDVIIDLLE